VRGAARVLPLGSPWIAISLAMAAFLVLVAGLAVYRRATRANPEIVRKLFHSGSGLLTLSFPFLFADLWPVLLLTGASAAVVATMKFLPAARRRIGGVVTDVDRTTLGELYFPAAVAVVFWFSRGRSPLLFCIPVLMLTLADATCALVGSRYGQSRYEGANKSLEGSIAFLVVAFFCVHIPLLLWSDIGRSESLLIAATLALVVMLLEGSAWRGLDNLFIPIGGYFLLSVYVTLDAAALLARLCVTSGLVLLVLLSRRTTTMADDALLAGVFLSYVAWALAGAAWLVPPLIVYVGYAWISPRTPENSRRVHAIAAMLSVWAAAIPWLVLGSRGATDAFYPYTLVFAAHLAMFGTSRLASDYPARPLSALIGRAAIVSWLLLFVPYATLTWWSARHLLAAVVSGLILAGVAVGFTRTNPLIRELPVTRRRWFEQAAWAAAASVAGWLLVSAASHAFSS
jgi:phytol kinase